MDNVTDISQEAPSYTVKLPGGESHEFDPIEAVVRLQEAGLMDDEGQLLDSDSKVVAKFREVIGLPSLTFSQSLAVLSGFVSYIEANEKKILNWLSLPQSTAGTQPQNQPQQPDSGSARISGEYERKSA